MSHSTVSPWKHTYQRVNSPPQEQEKKSWAPLNKVVIAVRATLGALGLVDMRKQSIRHAQTKWNKTPNRASIHSDTRREYFTHQQVAKPGGETWHTSTFIGKLYRLYLYCIVLHCSPAFPLWGPSPVTPPGLADTQTNAPERKNKKASFFFFCLFLFFFSFFFFSFFVEIGQDLGVAKVCHRVQLNVKVKRWKHL